MPRLRNANACRRATQQALTWLNGRFDSDEEWAARPYPLVTYHKVPYLFGIAGCVEECRRALLWIKGNLLTAEGDLLAAPAEEGKTVQPARVREKAWVALAAHLAGRFDVAAPVAAFLAKQQGQATGGVYNLDARGELRTSANVRTTACAGLVFVTSGLIKQARAAGSFVARAIRNQPEQKRFHVRLDTRGRLVRKFPKSEAAIHVVARARGQTELSFLGIPMVFLSKLYLATGENAWLEAAMAYYDFAGRYSAEARIGADSGTFGWGAAALYGITRRRFYYDTSEEMTQAWIDRQQPDGSWQPQDPDLPTTIATTAEGALSLLESIREAQ